MPIKSLHADRKRAQPSSSKVQKVDDSVDKQNRKRKNNRIVEFLSSQPLTNGTDPTSWDLDMRLWLILLLIICIGGLGSLSFVAPLSPIPLPISSAVIPPEGECQARSNQVHYLPSDKTGKVLVPEDWLKIGKTAQDLEDVQACATTFIIAYDTFSSKDFTTLETGSSMFSKGARLRFYGLPPYAQPNLRIDQQWRTTLKKQDIRYSVQSQMPTLLYTHYSSEKLLVWMAVPYLLSSSINGITFQQNKVDTVLLIDSNKGTGWQISDWRESQGIFTPPTIL